MKKPGGKNKKLRAICLFVFFCLVSSGIIAQTDTTNYEKYAGKVISVKVKNGNIYKGRVLEIGKEQLGINTEKTGMVHINISDIEEISEIHSIGSGNYSSDETYATRYFVTPNYLNLEKGSNYGKFSLFGPEFQFAAGKRLTLGTMMTWLASPIAFTAKFSFPLGKNFMPVLVALQDGVVFLFPKLWQPFLSEDLQSEMQKQISVFRVVQDTVTILINIKNMIPLVCAKLIQDNNLPSVLRV